MRRILTIACCSALAASLLVGAGAARTAVTRVTVTAGKPGEFSFTFSKKTIPVGAAAFTVTNKGAIPHDLKICASPKGGTKNTCVGKATKVLNVGQKTVLLYTFKVKGTYEYLCTIPGHAAGGMKGVLKVS